MIAAMGLLRETRVSKGWSQQPVEANALILLIGVKQKVVFLKGGRLSKGSGRSILEQLQNTNPSFEDKEQGREYIWRKPWRQMHECEIVSESG